MDKVEEKRWTATLVSFARLPWVLNITKTEARRWVDEKKIPVAKEATLWNRYKSYRTTLHDPAILEGLKSEIEKWRAEHAAQKSAHRKHAAKAAAQTRKSNESSLSLSEQRARLGVLRAKALLRSLDIGVELSRTKNSLLSRIAVDLPFDLKTRVAVLLPLPPEIQQVLLGEGRPVARKERLALVAALREAIETSRNQVMIAVRDHVKAWEKNARFLLDGLKIGDDPEVVANIERKIRMRIGRQTDSLSEDARNTADILHGLQESLQAGLSEVLTEWARSNQLDSQRRMTGLASYAALFPEARAIEREWIFHVGPTNSGKTHEALARLSSAPSGVYLAPLRLMALENFERLNENGVPTDLVTGEEVKTLPGARHISSTIEMADFSRRVALAVIDEIQLLTDRDRGWAWTQALIGIPADVVIMTGSAEALPFVKKAAQMTGDRLTVRSFDRKTPLAALPAPTPIKQIRQGDAVVAFSRRDVLQLRERLLASGRTVATIYGSLGPEVRSQQAQMFRSGSAEVLVATDAIGMGLNLPIKRLLFFASHKYDGEAFRPLSPPEIRQIAGRAGRFGFAEDGEVGVMPEASELLPRLQSVIMRAPDPIQDDRLHVMPPWKAVKETSRLLQSEDLGLVMKHICQNVLAQMEDLRAPKLEDILKIASRTQRSGLPLQTRFSYLGCPIDTRDESALNIFSSWAQSHAHGMVVDADALLKNLPLFVQRLANASGAPQAPGTDAGLRGCEQGVKTVSAYLWLSMRWPNTYTSGDRAHKIREALNQAIESALASKFIARSCRDCGDTLPKNHEFGICEECFRARRFNHSFERF